MDVKDKVCSFKSHYEAMGKCRKGVMWKDSVARYSNNGLVNTLKITNSIKNETYEVEQGNKHIIYEPKRRVVVSTKFKDRVFQRSLCDNYLYHEISKSFIYDNGACQNGKGTNFAMNRLNCHLQRFYRKHGSNGYVLKCDIKNYFGSTPHTTVKSAVRKNTKDDWAFNHVEKIIDSFNESDNPGIGLGLGSQVTQLVQLAVLDRLDHYIKEELKIKYYIRYMDDFILIHHDKEYLKECLVNIKVKIEDLGLRLNTKKTQILQLKQGIKFLGFRFILTETGKVIRLLNKENIKDEKRKLKKLVELVREGKITRDKVDDCYKSWKAHANKGNSYKLLIRMDKYYNNLWKE